MTIFDYLVLFVLASSVVISTMRGLVKEILSLLGWVVAFVVANAYGARLAPLLPSMIPGEAVRLMVAFVALFLGVRVLMGLLALAIGALITASGLSLADRGLGGLLHFLAMFIQARQEKHPFSEEAPGASDHVGNDFFIGMPEVGKAIDVIDRGGDVEPFVHRHELWGRGMET